PTNMDSCWAISSVAKATPKRSPRYLARSPVSIFSAIQPMTHPSFLSRECLHPARRKRAAKVDTPLAKILEADGAGGYTLRDKGLQERERCRAWGRLPSCCCTGRSCAPRADL